MCSEKKVSWKPAFYKKEWKKEKKTTIITTTVFLGARGGGRKNTVPADTVDTLRGGRKTDPQHNVVGKKGR